MSVGEVTGAQFDLLVSRAKRVFEGSAVAIAYWGRSSKPVVSLRHEHLANDRTMNPGRPPSSRYDFILGGQPKRRVSLAKNVTPGCKTAPTSREPLGGTLPPTMTARCYQWKNGDRGILLITPPADTCAAKPYRLASDRGALGLDLSAAGAITGRLSAVINSSLALAGPSAAAAS